MSSALRPKRTTKEDCNCVSQLQETIFLLRDYSGGESGLGKCNRLWQSLIIGSTAEASHRDNYTLVFVTALFDTSWYNRRPRCLNQKVWNWIYMQHTKGLTSRAKCMFSAREQTYLQLFIFVEDNELLLWNSNCADIKGDKHKRLQNVLWRKLLTIAAWTLPRHTRGYLKEKHLKWDAFRKQRSVSYLCFLEFSLVLTASLEANKPCLVAMCLPAPGASWWCLFKPPMCSHAHVLVSQLWTAVSMLSNCYVSPLAPLPVLIYHRISSERATDKWGGGGGGTLHWSLQCAASGSFRDGSVGGEASLLLHAPVVSSCAAWERSTSIRYCVTGWCVCSKSYQAGCCLLVVSSLQHLQLCLLIFISEREHHWFRKCQSLCIQITALLRGWQPFVFRKHLPLWSFLLRGWFQA